MPTEYQYSAAPQPLKPTKKYRPEDDQVPLNLLSDPRVIKGNTHALARHMAITKQASGKIASKTASKLPNPPNNHHGDGTKLSDSIPSMPFYDFAVHGFVGSDMSLDSYLVEQDYAPRVAQNVDTQTDAFNPRPQTPDFIPRKTGIDVSTQVEDVNDLFNFDEEVKPIVAVIVGKTIEQALFEVKAEMELLALEEDAAIYHRIKKVEEDWVLAKLQESRNEVDNKAKAIKLQQEEINKQIKLKTLVAGLQCMHQLIPNMLDSIETDCYASGRWMRDNISDITANFIAPTVATSEQSILAWNSAREVLDELMLEAQKRYIEYPDKF